MSQYESITSTRLLNSWLRCLVGLIVDLDHTPSVEFSPLAYSVDDVRFISVFLSTYLIYLFSSYLSEKVACFKHGASY